MPEPEPPRLPDLRDQIAEALYRRLREQVGSDMGSQIRAEAKADDLTDAVMHVIEAAMLAIEVDATQRADELAGRLQQAETDRDQLAARNRALDAHIGDVTRHRLAAEAAVRRVRQVHRRHDCTRHVSARTPVPCVNDGLCEGCGARDCRTLAALNAKETR